MVKIAGTDYLLEEKHLRRALPEDIPSDVVPSEMFELHSVLFDTQVLKTIELPQMVIREHIDIAIQVHRWADGQKNHYLNQILLAEHF